MAVDFDAVSLSNDAQTWNHIPVGTPAGVIVYCENQGQNITGCTYGGVVMTDTTDSPFSHASSPAVNMRAFFLGDGIPTGTQSVVVSGTLGEGLRATAITVTAGGKTKVQDTATIDQAAATSPRATLSLGGKECFCSMTYASAVNSSANITALVPGWTANSMDFHDFGSQVCGTLRYETIGSTDVIGGWDQTSDYAAAILVAITEDDAVGESTSFTGASGSITFGGGSVSFQGVVGSKVLNAQSGALVFSGPSAIRAISLISNPGSLSFTGGNINVGIAYTLDAQPGAITISGPSAALSVEQEAAVLAASPGALTFSGNASARLVKWSPAATGNTVRHIHLGYLIARLLRRLR